MRILLFRHAEAYPGSPDTTRRLTPYGEGQARRMGVWLARQEAVRLPATWCHSTLLRARQTAEIAAAHLASHPQPPRLRELAGLEPEAAPDRLFAQLRQAGTDVVLVGHNPHLSYLAGYLLTGELNDEPIPLMKGAAISFRSDRAALAPGSFVLEWAVVPEIV